MNFKNHSYWAIQSVAKDDSRLIKPILKHTIEPSQNANLSLS